MSNPELDATRKILDSMFRAELEKGGYSERSPRLDVVNLLMAEKAGLDKFAQQVEAHGGKVPVMVHPHYETETSPTLSPFASPFKPPSEFCALRDRFIETCVRQGVPLIIFEEAQRLRYEPLVAGVENFSGTLYVTETMPKTPDPLYPHTWEDIGKILHGAGVNHVVVGGALLESCRISDAPWWERVHFPSGKSLPIEEARQEINSYMEKIASQRNCNPGGLKAARWLRGDFIPGGCAGVAAIGFLKQGFDVTLSRISASASETVTTRR